MKLLLLFAFLSVALATDGVPPLQYQLHIPDKCEDVLAIKVCDSLRKTATALKLKSDEVKNAVVDAYQKGLATTTEIANAAEDFLVNKVMTKKCEDFTSADNCQKLRDMAAKAKVEASKVKAYVLKQVAVLKTKTCEDFIMSVDKCTKLRDLATKVKVKGEEFKVMVLAALQEAQQKGTDKVKEVYNNIKNYIVSTRCEDMFNPDLCAAMRKYAAKTKVALPKILETSFEVLKKGVSVGKAMVEKVFDIVDYFYDCEDVFDKGSCDRLRNWAATFKIKADEFEVAVRKYVRIAVEKATSFYKTLKDFIKEKFYCRIWPSSNKCQISDADVIAMIAEDDMGTKVEAWKQKILDILNKRFPGLDQKVREHIKTIIEKSKSFWQLMRNFAKEIKNQGQQVSQKIREALRKLMVEIATM
ncbi:uncharacterized protein [Clytia hemisphaerica]|uniref:Uncharacterized protein n=1 Tax=Clytia hemisphaerica TaxID=252671 RepID=A0A7M5WXP3_9CNID